MKFQYTGGLAFLIGLGIGAVAIQSLHAQAKPPAYVVAEIDVMNQEGYAKEYLSPSSKALLDNGAKYLIPREAITNRRAITFFEGSPYQKYQVE